MTTLNDPQAAHAIRAHHAEMAGELRRRVDGLVAAVAGGSSHVEAQDKVLEYLDEEVIPHAAAEEKALYPAGDTGPAALLVTSMRAEHVNLIGRVASLHENTDPIRAAAAAFAILALFESHLYKENELLVPTLVADTGVSLAVLLGGMHELLG